MGGLTFRVGVPSSRVSIERTRHRWAYLSRVHRQDTAWVGSPFASVGLPPARPSTGHGMGGLTSRGGRASSRVSSDRTRRGWAYLSRRVAFLPRVPRKDCHGWAHLSGYCRVFPRVMADVTGACAHAWRHVVLRSRAVRLPRPSWVILLGMATACGARVDLAGTADSGPREADADREAPAAGVDAAARLRMCTGLDVDLPSPCTTPCSPDEVCVQPYVGPGICRPMPPLCDGGDLFRCACLVCAVCPGLIDAGGCGEVTSNVGGTYNIGCGGR